MATNEVNTIITEDNLLCQLEAKLYEEKTIEVSNFTNELQFLGDFTEVPLNYKRFNFNSWTVNFVNDNRKIIMQPSILFLFSNGTFSMRRDWQSNLYSYVRPSNKLFQNFHFKENNLILDNDKLSFNVACGKGIANFKGTFDTFYYPLINRITIKMQGYAYNCR